MPRFCFAGMFCAVLAVLLVPRLAGANTALVAPYPDSDASDCSATYGVYSWCKGAPAATLSPRGYSYRNCTDGAAFWVRLYTGRAVPAGWGNANNWDNAAKGYTVLDGTTDAMEPGDIAQSDDGSLGHVAFVVEVRKDAAGRVTSFTTAELNKGGTGEFTGPDSNVYGSRNAAGKFSRGGSYDWDHFIDMNGPGAGLQIDGQEVTDGANVYTTAGGRYWFIKPKGSWTAADTAHWGVPVAKSTSDIHDQEVGWSAAGRSIGAHPPPDNTVVYIDGGNGQQFSFYAGKYFPIGAGELDDLHARDQAVPIPANGRLADYTPAPGAAAISNGTLYRFAGQPAIRQAVLTSSVLTGYAVGETTRACLTLQQGLAYYNELVLPAAARPYVPVQETATPAACSFNSGTVLRGPGGAEQWRIEGDGATEPYRRRYFPDPLTLYLHTSGRPDFQALPSTLALNGITEGPPMDIPEGVVFVNDGNGDEFVRRNSAWHKVLWPDMNGCLGIVSGQIIHVPPQAVGTLRQDTPMQCTYSNRILTFGGTSYYVDSAGRVHLIPNDAVQNCIAVRADAGQPVATQTDPATRYQLSATAYCPYQTDAGLNFVHEGADPTVWVVRLTEDGLVKYHVGGFCVPDPLTTQLKKYHLFRVPPGETSGIPQGEDWFPSPQSCGDLPGTGQEVHQVE